MLLVTITALLIPVATAPAAEVLLRNAVFGPDGKAGSEFGFSTDLAIDDANRKLYVFDRDPSPQIDAFNLPSHTPSGGAFPLHVAAGGTINGVGVDNTGLASAGRLFYASEGSPLANGQLFAFSSAGEELNVGNGFSTFPINPAAPKDLCHVAIDSNGNIYVSDKHSSVKGIRKYDAGGNFLGLIDTSSLVGSPCILALDSNKDLFISSFGGEAGTSGVYRYTAASEYTSATLIDPEPTFGVAIDTTTTPHRIYASHIGHVSTHEVDGTPLPEFTFGSEIDKAWYRGIAVDPSSHQIYAYDSNESKVFVFGYAIVPDVVTGSFDHLTGSSAIVHGVVNPQGVPVTNCYFQYTTEADYAIYGFANAASSNCGSVPGAGITNVPVASTLTGLLSGTDYRYRLMAANANGTGPEGAAGSFTTRGPRIREEAATERSVSDVVLGAEISPNGEGTVYKFEYVSSADFEQVGYATATSIPAASVAVGGGNGYVEVSQRLGGLAADHGYHFRAVATNSSGTTIGPDNSFSTLRVPRGSCPNPLFHTGIAADLLDCRAYEQVSPLDKNGYDVSLVTPIQSTPDGDRVAYSSYTGAFADPVSGSFPNAYVSTRDSGWQTENITPPVQPFPDLWGGGQVMGASGDLSKQLVASNRQLTPEATQGQINVYVHDSTDDSYEFVGTSPESRKNAFYPDIFDGYGSRQVGFVGGSTDGSHLFFSTGVRLDSTPPSPPFHDGDSYLYEVAESELKLVSVLPNGDVSTASDNIAAVPPLSSALSFQGDSAPSFHPVSEDGRRIYWTTGYNGAPLYLREDGESVLVSKRESDGSAQNAQFWYGSANGIAFFTSAGKLTAGASATGDDLYRYDPDTGELENLTADSTDANGADVKSVLGVSKDGSYVYFIANGVLTPGTKPGNCVRKTESNVPNGCSIYVWHNGNTRLIGRIETTSRQFFGVIVPRFLTDWRVSDNGRYFGFLFGGKLAGPHPLNSEGPLPTNPETGFPFKRGYLYDYQADTLDCASCSSAVAVPSGDPSIQLKEAQFFSTMFWTSQSGLTRAVSNSGQFFFTSPDALVDRDTNGKEDVYEYEQDHGVQLISSGQGDGSSFFGDASVDGDDVFFVTRDGLVGQDTDPNYDVYVARVNGGLSAQTIGAQGAGCQGDACQGAFTAPSPGSGPGTAVFSGTGNPKPKRAKGPKHKKHKKHKKHGRSRVRAAHNKGRAGA